MPTNSDTAKHYENPGREERLRQRQGERDAFSRALGEEPDGEVRVLSYRSQRKEVLEEVLEPEVGKGGLSDG